MNATETIKAGVMGDPIAHSLSPRLHGFWLNEYNINGSYEALHVPKKNLERSLRSLEENGFAGVNLTLPLKEEALAFVDTIDDTAKRIGAINTVIVKSDGTLFGTNTDAYGFIENLKAKKNIRRYINNPVILGGGGAARAVIVALQDAGAKHMTLTNRTSQTAEKLKQDFPKLDICPWEERADMLQEATLLVNTTSLGMRGKPPLELSLEKLPKDALVTDIVYNPLKTQLLGEAKTRGNPTVDGIGMLLYQAVPGFEAWFGHTPQVTEALKKSILKG